MVTRLITKNCFNFEAVKMMVYHGNKDPAFAQPWAMCRPSLLPLTPYVRYASKWAQRLQAICKMVDCMFFKKIN